VPNVEIYNIAAIEAAEQKPKELFQVVYNKSLQKFF
jgi:hypothetical protein